MKTPEIKTRYRNLCQLWTGIHLGAENLVRYYFRSYEVVEEAEHSTKVETHPVGLGWGRKPWKRRQGRKG